MKQLIAGILVLILVCSGCGVEPSTPQEQKHPEPTIESQIEDVSVPQPPAFEPRSDIPMDADHQKHLWDYCQEYYLPFELALAVIQKESAYDPEAVGDNGNSIGYMQIQPVWFQSEMDHLGITDVTDPINNLHLGCFILSTYVQAYDFENGLTQYNTGHTGYSPYAAEVIQIWKGLKNAE